MSQQNFFYFLTALLCEHHTHSTLLSKTSQSWEVEAFYHVFTSRLVTPPFPLSPPSFPKGSMTLAANSPPVKGGWTWVPQQCASGSVSARPHSSLPKGAGSLSCSAPAIPVAGQGLFTSFFFFFERAHTKAGSSFCHLLWVESSLTGAGNSNKKKQASSFDVVYLSHWCRQQTSFQVRAKDLDSS